MQDLLFKFLALIFVICITLGVATACSDASTSSNGGGNNPPSQSTHICEYVNGVCKICAKKKPSDGLKYNLINNDTEYEISGVGTCTDVNIIIPSVYNGKYVTSVGESAFRNNVSLQSVKIPDSITKIELRAFDGCFALTNVQLSNSLMSINYQAFANCTSLETIEIPNSLTFMGQEVFVNCSSLLYNIKEGVRYLGNSSNPYLCLINTENKNITSVSIDNNCKVVSKMAFYNYEQLTSVEIPEGVLYLNEFAFSGCTLLRSINIPTKVIGESVFSSCSSLESVTIGTGVKEIGDAAFRGCEALSVVNYLGTVDMWVEIDIGGTADYRYAGSTLMRHADYLYINNELVEDVVLTTANIINAYAFAGVKTLRSIEIPKSVTSIGDNAFIYCSSLTSVTFEENSQLINIGSRAFDSCVSLTSIEIPNSVTSIGEYAFYKCSSLTSVTFEENSQLTSIGSSAFRYCDSLTTIYYSGTAEDWSKISISSSNSSLTSATRYYYIENESDLPADNGNYWHYDENGNIAVWE